MGEAEYKPNVMSVAVIEAVVDMAALSGSEMRLVTPGGRYQVRWDEGGSATAMGQLPFFAEFLEVSGLFENWVRDCPMAYTSPNAPETRDVLGTWLLSILDGQWRYAHITGLRGDSVAPGILGMNKIVSDESLRRGLKHLAPALERGPEEEKPAREAQLAKTTAWIDRALAESTRAALLVGWILDIDTTIKLLYGHQVGAEISYNPTKPGRPSHVIHTYWIANMRLVLDAEVQGGKSHAARHSLPRLITLLKALPEKQRPHLVRGDIAFGVDPVMRELEDMRQAYLFKLKQTAGVKRLIERLWRDTDWQRMGDGYHAAETRLKLTGWEQDRRVVVVRRAVKHSLAVEAKPDGKCKGQQSLQFANVDAGKLWEYAVLVTNSEYPLTTLGQLYRDRADCENGFDELKNQWGWGGYTTQDLERCNLSARAVALIYNWWSWYVRLAHPKTRLEAITSRPLLLAGIARQTAHAGQTRLLVTLTHACTDQIKTMIANVRKGLDSVIASAPQLTQPERWKLLVQYIIAKILPTDRGRGPSPPQPAPPEVVGACG
jgi:hypothetical protein